MSRTKYVWSVAVMAVIAMIVVPTKRSQTAHDIVRYAFSKEQREKLGGDLLI